MSDSPTILYGIPNCDTVRKARAWLDARGLAYRFHDIRELPLARDQLDNWIERLGEDRVLNRASTTFRNLSDAEKQQSTGPALIDLILKHPTLMRRPVVEAGTVLLIGFKENVWQESLGSRLSD